jgi:hypothetical protein
MPGASQESDWTEIWSVSYTYLVVHVQSFGPIAPVVTKRAPLMDTNERHHMRLTCDCEAHQVSQKSFQYLVFMNMQNVLLKFMWTEDAYNNYVLHSSLKMNFQQGPTKTVTSCNFLSTINDSLTYFHYMIITPTLWVTWSVWNGALQEPAQQLLRSHCLLLTNKQTSTVHWVAT